MPEEPAAHLTATPSTHLVPCPHCAEPIALLLDFVVREGGERTAADARITVATPERAASRATP